MGQTRGTTSAPRSDHDSDSAPSVDVHSTSAAPVAVTTSALRAVPDRSWRQFAVAVLSGAVLSYGICGVRWWLLLHRMDAPPWGYPWKWFFLWGTLSVVLEELVYRGLILRYLARVHWLLGLVVSSAAFAAGHLLGHRLSHLDLTQSFLVGLWLGALYLRSRSVLVTIAAHETFNIVVKLWQVLVLRYPV